jgi:hypothetical protein
MCACEPSFVCVACRDTRNDDRYPDNERELAELWAANTKAEQEAWVKDGTIPSWRSFSRGERG